MDIVWSVILTVVGGVIVALVRESYIRHRDAKAAAAALAGELSSYEEAFELFSQTLPALIEIAEKGYIDIPRQTPPRDEVYEAYVGKLGLLGSDLAREVATIYGRIRFFRSAWVAVEHSAATGGEPLSEALLNTQKASKKCMDDVPQIIEKLKKHADQRFLIDHYSKSYRDENLT